MNKPLWVLDTNVVLDLLHFDDAVARPLRAALEDGRVRCVATDATLDEWRRVLAYPEFALTSDRQADLFARYQALSVRTEGVEADTGVPRQGAPNPSGNPVWHRIPRCSDPDDQKFIDLAADARAQGLVSKDHAVLRLRRRCAPLYRVMTPAEAVRRLSAADAAA